MLKTAPLLHLQEMDAGASESWRMRLSSLVILHAGNKHPFRIFQSSWSGAVIIRRPQHRPTAAPRTVLSLLRRFSCRSAHFRAAFGGNPRTTRSSAVPKLLMTTWLPETDLRRWSEPFSENRGGGPRRGPQKMLKSSKWLSSESKQHKSNRKRNIN